jgi:hypothetical protein
MTGDTETPIRPSVMYTCVNVSNNQSKGTEPSSADRVITDHLENQL